MSATVLAPRSSTASGLSAAGIVRSEWIKLRSLRSTLWSYAIVVFVSLGMAFLLASTVSVPGAGGSADLGESMLIQAATFGANFGVLVVAVLGVLVISGEYSTGMARSTFTAVPKRLPALAAKGLVLFVATFVVGLVSAAGSAALALPILTANGFEPHLTGQVVSSLVLSALYLGLVSLFALGLGTVLRNGAGGIAAALGILLLLPTVVLVIAGVTQAQWASDLMPYLLTSAGEALYRPGPGSLDFWPALVTLALWAGVPLAAGALSLKLRDA